MHDAPSGPVRRSPAAMSVADVARVLCASGSRHATEAAVQADLDAGAPTNADGSVNLVHYAAWLVRQVAAQEQTNGG